MRYLWILTRLLESARRRAGTAAGIGYRLTTMDDTIRPPEGALRGEAALPSQGGASLSEKPGEGDPVLKAKLLEFAAGFPFFRHMSFEVMDMRPGWARVQVHLRDELRNPNGQIHGGVLASLIDMSITQAMLLTETYQKVRETRGTMSSVDLRVKYLRAMGEGVATAESTIVHPGRRIVHASSVVTDASGRRLALGDSTLSIVLGKG